MSNIWQAKVHRLESQSKMTNLFIYKQINRKFKIKADVGKLFNKMYVWHNIETYDYKPFT